MRRQAGCYMTCAITVHGFLSVTQVVIHLKEDYVTAIILA